MLPAGTPIPTVSATINDQGGEQLVAWGADNVDVQVDEHAHDSLQLRLQLPRIRLPTMATGKHNRCLQPSAVCTMFIPAATSPWKI